MVFLDVLVVALVLDDIVTLVVDVVRVVLILLLWCLTLCLRSALQSYSLP